MSVLEIKNLHVSIEDKEILKGVNLTLKTGEIAAIMGPMEQGSQPSQQLSWAIQTTKLQKVRSFLMEKIFWIWKLMSVHVWDFS